jgi:hypothetical protein
MSDFDNDYHQFNQNADVGEYRQLSKNSLALD